ncbi:MAG TPA: TMEM165/GDT1 family protein [Dehalococcoidia bacterium]|nr:TMEM165/GDT1 family protein [Dehalococcoidia bacterium]
MDWGMDWRVLSSAFGLIFLAELGDKTQLAVVAMAAREKAPLVILAGALAGFLLATVIAVVVGLVGARFVPTEVIEKVAAVAFIVIGVLILLDRL